MYTLRLTTTSEEQNKYSIKIMLESHGQRSTATGCFKFELTPQDQEDLRWYLEDYLQHPLDPAPKIAARIQKRIIEIAPASICTPVPAIARRYIWRCEGCW